MEYEVALNHLRQICLDWPEVLETTTYGNPTFVAGKRTFAVLDRYKGEYSIAFKATHADQAALTMRPMFFITPYSGKHGWTSLQLSDDLDWDDVRDLIRASYELVALKRMIREMP